MGELRTVDDDERVGLGGDGCGGGAVDAPQDLGQPGHDRPRPHHRHVLHRKLRDEALLRHLRAADAEVADAAAPALVQGRHQLGAERVARMLAGNHEQPQILPGSRIGLLAHAVVVGIHPCTLRSAAPPHHTSHNTRNSP